MLTFVTLIHLFIAVILIIFVLLQDSKGGGAAGVFGGGSSNTLFGSTGGADFLTKVTRYTAIGFAVSCLALAYMTSDPSDDSLMDNYVPSAATDTVPATTSDATTTSPVTTEKTTKKTAPSVPATDSAPPAEKKK